MLSESVQYRVGKFRNPASSHTRLKFPEPVRPKNNCRDGRFDGIDEPFGCSVIKQDGTRSRLLALPNGPLMERVKRNSISGSRRFARLLFFGTNFLSYERSSGNSWYTSGSIGRSVPFFEIDSHLFLKFIGVRSHIELHRCRTTSFP